MRSKTFPIRWLAVLIVPATMAVIVGAWNPAPTEDLAAARLAAVLVSVGPASGDCPTQCEYSCFGDRHRNQSHQLGTNEGTTHSCQFTEKGCQDHTCSGGDTLADAGVDLLELERLIRTLPVERLESIAREQPRLTINSQRHAAQIAGCEDTVLLSIALAAE